MSQAIHFARRLNDADAKFFFMSRRPECNAAMVMLAVLARDTSLRELQDTLLPYETEIPRFTDYLRQAPLNLAPPVWMPVEGFDVDDYVLERHLPPGSSWGEVFAAVDEIQSAPFPPEKAPWEIVLLHGAPDGRAVLVMKVHHTLSDGMALTLLFVKAFGGRALAEASAEIEVRTEPPPAASPARLALEDRVRAVRAWLRRLGEELPSLRDRSRRRREREAAARVLRPGLRWPLAEHETRRRLSGYRVPIAVWAEAARTRGGGNNDLYLALVARVMRKGFPDLDFEAMPLRVVMPISMRGEGDQDARNATSIGLVELRGREEELADLSEVRERAARAKEGAGEMGPSLFESALELLPGRLRAAIDFRQFAACDVVATSIPIPIEGEIDGIPIETMFMVAPALGAAASFSLTTYGEDFYLACNADRGIVPAPLDGAIEEVLEDLFGADFERFGEVISMIR
jgi:diacylglycerol O-acyltransferase